MTSNSWTLQSSHISGAGGPHQLEFPSFVVNVSTQSSLSCGVNKDACRISMLPWGSAFLGSWSFVERFILKDRRGVGAVVVFEEGGGVEGIDVSLDAASTFYHFFYYLGEWSNLTIVICSNRWELPTSSFFGGGWGGSILLWHWWAWVLHRFGHVNCCTFSGYLAYWSKWRVVNGRGWITIDIIATMSKALEMRPCRKKGWEALKWAPKIYLRSS